MVAQASPPELDLRLSKGFGSRGYGSVRVSSINDDVDAVKPDAFFSYAAPFQHRWTNFTLRTTVLEHLLSGESIVSTTLGNFTLRLPAQGTGVAGLVMGDPCFINGSFHPCTCGSRIARLLNAVAPSSDFRALLGDNLYDRDGSKTALLYSMLSARAKETLQLAVPGNHDFWEAGEQLLLKEYDQFGNGFMQVYSQDVAAALSNASSPFDFSLNPNLHRVASGDNFFFYHSIGNVVSAVAASPPPRSCFQSFSSFPFDTCAHLLRSGLDRRVESPPHVTLAAACRLRLHANSQRVPRLPPRSLA
jgi:hypothetical protein